LISDVSFNSDDEFINIKATVISENLFSEYLCKFDINKKNKEIAYFKNELDGLL